jgi:RNAse P Rpr2/Rpp21/SNM1 subunit family protein
MAGSQDEIQAAQARLNYLTDAGHMLAISAPQVSSFLMTRRQALTARLGFSMSELEKQVVCGACGNVVIPGCSGKLNFEADKVFKRRRRGRNLDSQGKKPPVERSGPVKVISCERCCSTTRTRLPPPSAIERRKVEPLHAPIIKQGSQPTAPKNSNAASKKRAKARKAGLQGLLANSAAALNSRPALTLSTFMKN